MAQNPPHSNFMHDIGEGCHHCGAHAKFATSGRPADNLINADGGSSDNVPVLKDEAESFHRKLEKLITKTASHVTGLRDF